MILQKMGQNFICICHFQQNDGILLIDDGKEVIVKKNFGYGLDKKLDTY